MKLGLKKVLGISLTGILLIAGYEGLSNKAYPDVGDVTTICYGHTATAKIGQRKTNEECFELLVKDANHFGDAVRSSIKAEVSQEEIDAYSSFAYNVGIGAFQKSTLLKKVNAGDRVGACNELLKWVYAAGKKWQGLVNRRQAENKLCLSGIQPLK